MESRQVATEIGNGNYVLERASHGEMKVETLVRGYVSQRDDFLSPLEEGQDHLLIRLEEGKQLGGHIISAKTQEPLPGAVILASGLPATTDEKGYFLLDWLREGSHELSITAPGHVELRTGAFHTGALDVQIELEPEAALRGC